MFREEKGLVMQRVNEYRFYDLGQKLQRIKDIAPQTEFAKCFITLWEARDALILCCVTKARLFDTAPN